MIRNGYRCRSTVQTNQSEIVHLENPTIIATHYQSIGLNGVPDDRRHRALCKHTKDQLFPRDIPDDYGTIVPATGEVSAVRREAQHVDSVAVTRGEGLDFNIRGRFYLEVAHVGRMG